MSSQQFCLKWNNHTNNMLNVFEHLLSTEALVDVTLACDGLSLKAHKMVLSACSPFFQSLFLENPCKHPIVIMKDMSYKDLKAIIDFMYRGEVNVSQDQLSALLKTAETLKVKGLAEVSGENRQASGVVQQEITQQPSAATPSASSQQIQSKRAESPPMTGKRKRGRPRKRSLSDSNRSDDEVPSKIKDPDSPEIEELSNDASMEGNDMLRHGHHSNSSSQGPIHHQSSVNSFTKHHPSNIHQNAQVEEPPSGEENEFEVEPSKLLEQTLTTDNVPSMSNAASSSTISSGHFNLPSSSGMEISQIGLSSDSQALVPVSGGQSDSLGSSHLQGPDSPQDIKPAILTFEEPAISPAPGTSQSDRQMMMYMDQSSLPGPSNYQDNQLVQHDAQPQDIDELFCKYCKNKPDRLCKHCSCIICGRKHYPEHQLVCYRCDEYYHTWCLVPPLLHIPDNEWYCADCKNDKTEIAQAGEKVQESKKRAKMASSSSKRNWGKGMASISKTKTCTIVPSHLFGRIPGIEVGMMWKFRVQLSEVGVHCRHGRDNSGAYSLVLSGGYEDDLDEGERFTYTGRGGDLPGNKSTAEQSCDQRLTRMNRALALNCDAPINRNGATSKNWKAGKPVRVVRNFKGRKHSKYCPQQGNRYDGIYKVVKYWPETGKSGFLVWRYLLRRDDPTPAPWTPLGKHRIQRLGFVMQYPDGYEDPVEGTSRGTKRKLPSSSKETSKVTKRKAQSSCKGTSKATKKELLSSSDSENDSIAIKQELGVAEEFRLPSDVESLIMKDTKNQKLWEECKKCLSTKVSFLKEVEKCFQCICCQDLVANPITTTCKHNICKHCLERSFKAEVFCCPMCRHMLGKNYVFTINNMLKSTLKTLFFGYDAGR